jgi:hypothetical protein
MTRPSPKQVRLYRYLCNDLHLTDDERRAVTHEMFGTLSTAGLTDKQMTRLTQRLLAKLGRDPNPKLAGGLSKRQAWKIRSLAKQLKLLPERENVLVGIIKKATRRAVRIYGGPVVSERCKHTVEDCDKHEASNVIEALKDLLSQGYDPDNLKRGTSG